MKIGAIQHIMLALFIVLSVAAPTHAISLVGTPLPPSAEARLRKVEKGVKSLQTPAQQALRRVHPITSTRSHCSLLGGLVSANTTSHCCISAQVVTQRQLKQHGIAQSCKADWQCEADGVTPLPSFEKQMLSSMCGEPGCLPAVVAALKSNRLTMKGANKMTGICASLASMGGDNAPPGEVNKLLLGDDREEKVCKETHCKDEKTKINWCAMDEHRLNSCYVHCCTESSCFPGEATAIVQGQGKVSLAKLKTGDHVLVKSNGQLAYEPVLAFLHAMRAPGEAMPFVTVTHVNGEFRASAAHIVFVSSGSEDHGWTSKLVGNLKVGDQVFIANDAVAMGASDSIRPSIVLAIGHGTTVSGMYAPLTASGTIVVDGVVASNYASSAVDKSLSHSLAHAFLFPLRLYHRTGLAAALQPSWQRLCNSRSASKKWLCQGGNLGDGDAEAEAHQMHPYVRLMWKGFKLDMLLLSE